MSPASPGAAFAFATFFCLAYLNDQPHRTGCGWRTRPAQLVGQIGTDLAGIDQQLGDGVVAQHRPAVRSPASDCPSQSIFRIRERVHRGSLFMPLIYVTFMLSVRDLRRAQISASRAVSNRLEYEKMIRGPCSPQSAAERSGSKAGIAVLAAKHILVPAPISYGKDEAALGVFHPGVRGPRTGPPLRTANQGGFYGTEKP